MIKCVLQYLLVAAGVALAVAIFIFWGMYLAVAILVIGITAGVSLLIHSLKTEIFGPCKKNRQ